MGKARWAKDCGGERERKMFCGGRRAVKRERERPRERRRRRR